MSSTAHDPSSSLPPLLPEIREAWAVITLSRGLRRAALQEVADTSEGTGLRTTWLSLETQQAFYEAELRRDDTDHLDRLDPGTSGLDVLRMSGRDATTCQQAANEVGIGSLMGRGYRLLSTGESRLLLLLREILAQPELLVVEQPFDGLDVTWRVAAERQFARLLKDGGRLLVFADRASDVPICTTHALVLQTNGPPLFTQDIDRGQLQQWLVVGAEGEPPQLPAAPVAAECVPDPLVRMRDCAVRYPTEDGKTIAQFEHLNWQLKQGEHTLVLGPNGAGKSTLLQMLSGDHPQSYGNDLRLFGIQRGSGESIWDIKKNIGLVSPALHRDYRARGNLLSVVISGLYDSIGLYQQPSEPDKQLALSWLSVLGLEQAASQRFDQLAWSQQRLVLIARGLIKHPPLLILDEPTQGLDEWGRQLVLAFLPRLARLQRTTLLMVTHREDEQLSFFSRRLKFEASADPGVRYTVQVD